MVCRVGPSSGEALGLGLVSCCLKICILRASAFGLGGGGTSGLKWVFETRTTLQLATTHGLSTFLFFCLFFFLLEKKERRKRKKRTLRVGSGILEWRCGLCFSCPDGWGRYGTVRYWGGSLVEEEEEPGGWAWPDGCLLSWHADRSSDGGRFCHMWAVGTDLGTDIVEPVPVLVPSCTYLSFFGGEVDGVSR